MTLRDSITSLFRRTPDADTPVSFHPSREPAALIYHGGLDSSIATNVRALGGADIAQPPDAIRAWRNNDMDVGALDKESPAKILEYLSDMSPDLSRALWDFLRFCNPGWEIEAYKPGTQTVDKKARKALQAFLKELQATHGSIDIIFNRFYMSAFLRGAFFSELVLDKGGRVPLNILAPDPANVRFRKIADPKLGERWEMGVQERFGDFVPIEKPTVMYLPVDPFPNSPYGRPLASPAIFSILFLIGMLHDLRRVVAQQGYPRIDVEIDLEKLAKSVPPEVSSNSQLFTSWVQGIIDDVKRVYAKLQPEDAYIHTSVVKVNEPIGTVDMASLGAVKTLIDALERMAMRALKSMPIFMGIQGSVSEANANRQWEIHAAGIKALQHSCETMIEHQLEMALQAQGITADVEMRFAELRSAEKMRDAQTEQLIINNVGQKYLWGYISHEDASFEVAGQAPDNKGPRIAMESADSKLTSTPEITDASEVVADPGSDRHLQVVKRGVIEVLDERDIRRIEA